MWFFIFFNEKKLYFIEKVFAKYGLSYFSWIVIFVYFIKISEYKAAGGHVGIYLVNGFDTESHGRSVETVII